MEIYTDASTGETAIGIAYVVIPRDKPAITGRRSMEGDFSSMDAEYHALMEGLRIGRAHGHEAFAYTDCKPLVEKMRVPDGTSELWYQRRRGCHRLLQKYEDWELEWVPRSENTQANRLAREALWSIRDDNA